MEEKSFCSVRQKKIPSMQNKKERIGILGGTFNPIHMGHIALGKAAYEQYHLDKILVMVSRTPPHKSQQEIPDGTVRSEMVKLAIKPFPFMEYSDFELNREGYIYTADTLKLLTDMYPDNKYYFIIGGDSLAHFDTWYHPEEILHHAVILASGRNQMEEEEIQKNIAYLKKKYSYGDIRSISLPAIPYSSTSIREMVQHQENISDMVGEEVAEYIKKQQLYHKRKQHGT